MADVNLFGYYAVDSYFHRVHPLVKILSLLLLSTGIFFTGLRETAVSALLLLLLFPVAGIPAGSLKPALGFIVFLIVTLFGTIPLTGNYSPDFILSRTESFFRLLFFLFMGILFTATTAVADIRLAVHRILALFRFLPVEKIVLLITFTFSLLPLVFSLYSQVGQAQQVRGMGKMRNPVRRIYLSMLPFLSLLFYKSDKMADAYTVRCLSGRFHPAGSKFSFRDIPVLAISLSYFTGSLLLRHGESVRNIFPRFL